MAEGGLFDPLGTDRDSPPRSLRIPTWLLVAALVIAAVAALLAVAAIRDGGDRGEPRGVSLIERPPASIAVPNATATSTSATVAPGAAASSTPGLPSSTATMPGRSAGDDQEVEIQHGVRIIRPRRSRAQGEGQMLIVPGATAVSPSPGR